LISLSYFDKKLFISTLTKSGAACLFEDNRHTGQSACVGFFFLFPRCSHQVFTGFSTCSQISQYVSQHVPNSTSLCPIALPNVIFLEPIQVGGHRDLYFSMFRVNTSFRTFFVMGQSKRLIAKKILNLEASPQLNNVFPIR
jgi:hypothetical protein